MISQTLEKLLTTVNQLAPGAISPSEAGELVQWAKQAELDTAFVNSLQTGGALVNIDELWIGGARLFRDGAGNLQLDLDLESDQAFTVNDGNLIVGKPTDDNASWILHDNSTAVASMDWDSANDNLVINNDTTGGDIVFAVPDATSGGWFFYNLDGAYHTHAFTLKGGFQIRRVTSAPLYLDGYASIYVLTDEAGADSLRVRYKDGATEVDQEIIDLTP